jgi:hypothetical protein
VHDRIDEVAWIGDWNDILRFRPRRTAIERLDEGMRPDE